MEESAELFALPGAAGLRQARFLRELPRSRKVNNMHEWSSFVKHVRADELECAHELLSCRAQQSRWLEVVSLQRVAGARDLVRASKQPGANPQKAQADEIAGGSVHGCALPLCDRVGAAQERPAGAWCALATDE